MRQSALSRMRCLNHRPERVRDEKFINNREFFDPEDKLQVKYEMLRSHVVDRMPVVRACALHGYSRQSFYNLMLAFREGGLAGLLDDKPGRKGPIKCTPEIRDYIRARHKTDPSLSGSQLAQQVEQRFGVRLHRRTVEKACRSKKKLRT